MSGRFWTTLEVAVLRRYYPTEGRKVAARLPGRTEYACVTAARQHGIRAELWQAATLPSIRAQCRVDHNTGCWHWLGGTVNGRPRVSCREPGETRRTSMSAARAVFILVHGRAPRGIAFMGCQSTDCASPVHVREGATRGAVGQHHRLSKRLVGTALEQRRQNAAKARATFRQQNAAEPRREAA